MIGRGHCSFSASKVLREPYEYMDPMHWVWVALPNCHTVCPTFGSSKLLCLPLFWSLEAPASSSSKRGLAWCGVQRKSQRDRPPFLGSPTQPPWRGTAFPTHSEVFAIHDSQGCIRQSVGSLTGVALISSALSYTSALPQWVGGSHLHLHNTWRRHSP